MIKFCYIFLTLHFLYFNFCCAQQEVEPVVLVHGGAGVVPSEQKASKLKGVTLAAKSGYKVLKDGGSVVDAVETAIRSMEDDEMFNAGCGSVLNLNKEVEMDASIMVGSNFNAGGVTIVQNIANPISLARMVMEKTPHILLGAKGAEQFAKDMNVEILHEGSLVTLYALEELKNITKKNQGTSGGTVGCVAIDRNGHVAAGTSTGGLSGKMPGRCSDSSQIGSGTYADDKAGAVSSTGHGESISKYGLSRAIVNAMLQGKSASQAAEDNVKQLSSLFKNEVGAITLSNKGEIGIAFSSPQMPWAYQQGEKVYFGLESNQTVEQKTGNMNGNRDHKI